MLVARVKLPEVIKRKYFDSLSKKFSCIEETEGRVGGTVFGVEVMGEKDVYIDECTTDEKGFYYEGLPIDSYYVKERPPEEYAIVKNREVILDVDRFYKVTSEVSLTILQAIPVEVEVDDLSTEKLVGLINLVKEGKLA